MMHLAHLTASTLFGGPERQMLGLAEHLPSNIRTTFVSFSEGGRCREFLGEAARHEFDAVELTHDMPHLWAATREITRLVQERGIDVLLCHGYKANLLGRVAARRVGVPVVAVSRGWTWESLKVRAYESLDRMHLRFMDRVVCVSDGQAVKVRRAGVPERKVHVIRNSARLAAFANRDPASHRRLLDVFPSDSGVSRVVVAAGRLSPEKGFDVLAAAAKYILAADPAAGVVLFGDGPERSRLDRLTHSLGKRFVMPGFSRDLDRLVPWADVFVSSSYTEGLPNVVLEASAAGVPVVATAVGGTPEVVSDARTGYLVPAGDPGMLSERVLRLLGDASLRRRMGDAGRERMRSQFSFEAQASEYLDLLTRLACKPAGVMS